jgi:hypothetical protein
MRTTSASRAPHGAGKSVKSQRLLLRHCSVSDVPIQQTEAEPAEATCTVIRFTGLLCLGPLSRHQIMGALNIQEICDDIGLLGALTESHFERKPIGYLSQLDGVC